MAKRFIDTTLGRKTWFRILSPKMKCVWRFLCDECDHAGIWEIDVDALDFYIGEKVSLDEIVLAFGSRIEHLPFENKLYLSAFVEFQYGQLNAENRVHKSVLARLNKLQIKPLVRGYEGASVRAKDTDKDMDTDIPKNRNWRDAAHSVLEMLARYGDWAKSEAEVRSEIGSDLFDIACRAGTHKMRMLPSNTFALPAVMGMLKDANNQLRLTGVG